MKDRTTMTIGARQVSPTLPKTITTMPTVPPAQPDEFLRRSKIETAQAAVKAIEKQLDNTYLDSAERWNLTREHETAVRRLAVLRTGAGTGTLADYRLLHPKAAQAAEDRFWASNDTWDAAGRRLTADLAAINTTEVRV